MRGRLQENDLCLQDSAGVFTGKLGRLQDLAGSFTGKPQLFTGNEMSFTGNEMSFTEK
jgi:hypothetical protein